MKDARAAIVAWAHWLVTEEERRRVCTYSEGANRYANLNHRGILPYVGDCSSTIRNYYNWAGAPDPYKLGYGVLEGYTGTELAAGNHIPLLIRNGAGARIEEVKPGDAIVYGPGTGWHTALVVNTDNPLDPMTISMGRQGAPEYCFVSQDGREPQTYLRFNTMTKRVYYPPIRTAGPSKQLVDRMGFVTLTDPSQAQLARENGWLTYAWNGYHFQPTLYRVEPHRLEYASWLFASPKGK